MAILMPDERYYLDHKISISSENPVLVDVGAYKGGFTEEFLRKFPKAHVLAFEPILKLADDIRRMFYQYDVQVYAFGVGETLKWSNFYEVARGMECSSIYYRSNFHGDLHPKPIISLDMLYPTILDHIDYLKIDVEGNELNVLRGAEYLLRHKRIRYIQFEYGECYPLSGVELNEVIRMLLPNYKVFHKEYGDVNEDFNLNDSVVRNFFAEAREN